MCSSSFGVPKNQSNFSSFPCQFDCVYHRFILYTVMCVFFGTACHTAISVGRIQSEREHTWCQHPPIYISTYYFHEMRSKSTTNSRANWVDIICIVFSRLLNRTTTTSSSSSVVCMRACVCEYAVQCEDFRQSLGRCVWVHKYIRWYCVCMDT